MKTWQAALIHVGATAAQAALGVQFFNGEGVGGSLGNIGVNFGAQFALTALQLWTTKKNSNTDPNGKPLTEVKPGVFQSVPAQPK